MQVQEQTEEIERHFGSFAVSCCARDNPLAPLGGTPSHPLIWLVWPGTSDYEASGVRGDEFQPVCIKAVDETTASFESLNFLLLPEVKCLISL